MDEMEKAINDIYNDRRKLSKKYGKENSMKERLKSPVFWTQLVLLIAEAIKLCGGYEISNELLNNIQDFITLGFQIFAGLNNPTDRKNF